MTYLMSLDSFVAKIQTPFDVIPGPVLKGLKFTTRNSVVALVKAHPRLHSCGGHRETVGKRELDIPTTKLTRRKTEQRMLSLKEGVWNVREESQRGESTQR